VISDSILLGADKNCQVNSVHEPWNHLIGLYALNLLHLIYSISLVFFLCYAAAGWIEDFFNIKNIQVADFF
jgi:hypothetical protein